MLAEKQMIVPGGGGEFGWGFKHTLIVDTTQIFK